MSVGDGRYLIFTLLRGAPIACIGEHLAPQRYDEVSHLKLLGRRI
jgi:hypothetical protein